MGKVEVGDKIRSVHSCLRNPRTLVKLGSSGNRRKHRKGGCKFGWRYRYLDQNEKMRTGCYRGPNGQSPKVRVSALRKGKHRVKGGLIIPNYVQRPRKSASAD